jgi:opacity protein-like surface antigen
MSRFYANIQGNRGSASREGSEKSGIEGHIRGWNIGARVRVEVDDLDRDTITIYITGGSAGLSSDEKFVGKWQTDPDLGLMQIQ